MGFRIENVSEVSNIANTMSSNAEIIKSFASQTQGAVEGLINIISGLNVETTLKTFNERLGEYVARVSNMEKRLTEFLGSQARGYQENEDNMAADLAKIESLFDDISFE